MFANKTERLISLLPWLVNAKSISIHEICEKYGISTNQALTDLSTLTMTGPGEYGGQLVDIQVGKDRVTVIDPQGLTYPLRLDETESKLLAIEILELSIRLPDTMKSVALGLVQKLHHIEELILDANSTPCSTINIDEMMDAISKGLVIEFEYKSSKDDVSKKRIVAPKKIEFRFNKFYLQGFCLENLAMRTFIVDKIKNIGLSTRRVSPIYPNQIDDAKKAITIVATIARSLQSKLGSFPNFFILDQNDHSMLVRFDVYQEEYAIGLLLNHWSSMKIESPKLIEEKALALLAEFEFLK